MTFCSDVRGDIVSGSCRILLESFHGSRMAGTLTVQKFSLLPLVNRGQTERQPGETGAASFWHQLTIQCEAGCTDQQMIFLAHARQLRSRSLTHCAAPASRDRLRGFGMVSRRG